MSDQTSHRHKHRPATARQSRARAFVRRSNESVKPILKNLPESSNKTVGSFAVRRFLTAVHANASADDPIWNYLTISSSGVHRGTSVSVLSPAQAFDISKATGISTYEMRDAIRESVNAFPITLAGRLAGVAINGAKEGNQGPRYISYRFDKNLGNTLIEERNQIMHDLGFDMERFNIPHLSVHRTFDQHEAVQTAEELRRITPQGIWVELGEPQIVPVRSVESR